MVRDMLCLTYSYDVHAHESHALPRQTRVQYGDVNTGGVDSGAEVYHWINASDAIAFKINLKYDVTYIEINVN